MAEQDAELDAERVRALFHELSQRLADRGVQAQLFVVGGAAMALAYDRHRSTRDVDALFIPAPAVRAAVEEIGATHGLEPDWLNDAAKGFLPGPDQHPQTVFESESLLVQVPSPEYLLAMKLHASRGERDLDDAATLFNRLGYATAEQAIDLLSHTYPPGQLLPRHHYIAEDVAQRAARRRAEQETLEPPAADEDETRAVAAESIQRAMLREQGRYPESRRTHLGPSESISPPSSSRPPEPPGIGF